LRTLAALVCVLSAAACSLFGENQGPPANIRGLIIANKALLWRNADTIRNASIAAPLRQDGLWRICVRMKVQGPLGTSNRERDFLVAVYGEGKPPELLMTDAAAVCATQPHSPFPELDSGYELDPLVKRGGGRK
jgi:hypothetical protein